ncbi:MAG: hypothetical protein ACRCVW_03365 [Brevinema sp.]
MIQQVTSNITVNQMHSVSACRTKNLVHFYRAVALFSIPIRSSALGLRRRK